MLKSHIIWNENHPEDRIEVEKGCGTGNYKEVIHHKDGDHENDDPKNQKKMIHGKHVSFHMIGKNHGLGNKSKTGMKHTKKQKTIMKGNKYGFGNKGSTGMKNSEEHKRKIREAKERSGRWRVVEYN